MSLYLKSDLSVKEEKFRKKIQNSIEYCLYCQPYDEGEAIWIHGERTELDDLFYDLDVPEKSWDNILEHLYCPNCGLEGFELGIDIGKKTKFEKELDEHLDRVNKLYGTQLKEFEELLENYPLLALSNDFGKQIFKELKNQSLPITSIKGDFFRARKVLSSEVLDKTKMSNPPRGKSQEGRFNHAGQSYLYLASSKETAIREVVSKEESLLIWSQKFEIENEIKTILDLSFNWDFVTPSTSALLLSLKIFDSIGRNDRNNELWRPDYYLTRFIMDCAKKLGYQGIKYNSTKSYTDFDLVLFFPEKANINPKSDPTIEIFLNKKEKDSFSNF